MTTTTFGTDSNNDLYLGNDGNIAVLTGLQAVIMACETATKAQLGEMVLEKNQGIPTFQTVWNGTPNYSLYTEYLRKTLIGIQGVQEILNVNLRISENVLKYEVTIKTDFGTGVLNG